ncbi:immunity 17 family protein [Bacteroides sp. ET71]|uniref:immunity 17 family protein n=1 Tax=Bacteroides sp. ET71 TaxID=2939421 RepID=UPI002010D86A|nr:immunity 17 family protein [Bacteroides sp. ET71]MCL1617043.1 immunity 17 family protein [Bacteroides sp. ET71]
MDELINKISEKIAENPRYGYLIAGGILLLWLIGVICGWKWTYKADTWGWNWVRETFGERAVRFWHGVLLFLLLVLCIMDFLRSIK